MAEDARDRVALNRAVEEVRRDPAAALPVVRAEQEGASLNEMERKVAREAEAAYGELKRRYADSIFRTVAGGGACCATKGWRMRRNTAWSVPAS